MKNLKKIFIERNEDDYTYHIIIEHGNNDIYTQQDIPRALLDNKSYNIKNVVSSSEKLENGVMFVQEECRIDINIDGKLLFNLSKDENGKDLSYYSKIKRIEKE